MPTEIMILFVCFKEKVEFPRGFDDAAKGDMRRYLAWAWPRTEHDKDRIAESMSLIQQYVFFIN